MKVAVNTWYGLSILLTAVLIYYVGGTPFLAENNPLIEMQVWLLVLLTINGVAVTYVILKRDRATHTANKN